MGASKYISAEWVEAPDGRRCIKAIGDDGIEYVLPGDHPAVYDVPPWPDFVETAKGKAFLAEQPPDPPEAA